MKNLLLIALVLSTACASTTPKLDPNKPYTVVGEDKYPPLPEGFEEVQLTEAEKQEIARKQADELLRQANLKIENAIAEHRREMAAEKAAKERTLRFNRDKFKCYQEAIVKIRIEAPGDYSRSIYTRNCLEAMGYELAE